MSTSNNVGLLLQLILTGLQQLEQYRQMMVRAQTEGRDITEDELAELASRDDAVRAALEAEIARRRAGGG
jgi:hypothetical protein